MKTKIYYQGRVSFGLIIIFVILFRLFLINFNFEKNGVFAQTALALQNDSSALQDKISIFQGQVAELQIQLNEIQKIEPKTTLVSVATPAQTNTFIKTLQRNFRGDDVKRLQEFLKKYPDIYPEGLITGYFGPLTEKAVQRFQTKFQIVSSGSPVTTGYGFVGPKTRAKLNEFLSIQQPSTTTTQTVKPESSPTPAPSLTSKPAWPEWLLQERRQAIEDVRRMEKWALSAGGTSLQNDNLPLFLEWAKEHEIKFVGTGSTTKDVVSITAMPGIDIIYKELKNFPPHLIKLLRGTTVYLSTEYGGSTTWTESESESKTAARRAFIRQTKPPDEMTHELAHALDMVSIRVDNSSESTIGKTDEEVRLLKEEFDRVFQRLEEPWADPNKAPPGFINTYASTNSSENFATHFDYYINQPQYFRERAAKEPLLAEKYEFLKTKIFLGKEY